MLLDIFGSIIDTLGNLTASLGFAWLVIIGLSLVLLTVIIGFICTQFSIELKTLRATNRLNKYLELNPFVTEDNLVEFNKLMKRIPSTMRKQWQQFMVSRDKKPSEFFSEQNCVDKPFKSSSYASHIVAVRTFIISIALLGFVFGMSYFASGAADSQLSFSKLTIALLLPIVTVLLGEMFVLFLKARRNSTISDVYYNFDMFQKYLDRSVTTLPEYIDYEILFTRKEIVAGIPVLQEYLQQRALYEQEQIKKAKESQVVHEQYDFSALGINGSLVMEKAMQVSEQFIGNKNGTRAVISELEGERDLLEKNYEEKAKAAQRKLRDIQETLDRLKEKLDATTNLIVGNDLRKQRENEIQKQRQIEKEAQEDSRKFEEERKKINAQIEVKRAEIEEDRKRAETSLNSEFKSYADKIYSELKAIVDEQHKEEMDTLKAEATQMQMEMEEKDRIVVEKSTLYDETMEQLNEYTQKIEEQNQIIAEQESRLSQYGSVDDDRNKEVFAVKKELESRNIEIAKKDEIIAQKDEQIANQKEYISELKHKKHITGDEVYADLNGNMYFIDEDGNKKYVNQGESSESVESVAEEANLEEVDSSQVEETLQNEEENAEQLEVSLDAEHLGEESGASMEELIAEAGKQDGYPGEESINLDLDELKSKFHKPTYDFRWENSNSLSAVDEEEEVAVEPAEQPVEVAEPEPFVEPEPAVEPEPVAEVEEPKEEEVAEPAHEEVEPKVVEEPVHEEVTEEPVAKEGEAAEPVEEVVEEPEVAEEEPEAEELEEEKKDELEELDKLIEEKSAELEKQNQDLSKQLEETQKVAGEKPKAKKKPAAKKASEKSKAKKKPASKSEKKAPAKKSADKPHKKVTVKKPSPAKSKEPKKEESGNPLGGFNLAQFNEQLKNMLKGMDDKGGNEK